MREAARHCRDSGHCRASCSSSSMSRPRSDRGTGSTDCRQGYAEMYAMPSVPLPLEEKAPSNGLYLIWHHNALISRTKYLSFLISNNHTYANHDLHNSRLSDIGFGRRKQLSPADSPSTSFSISKRNRLRARRGAGSTKGQGKRPRPKHRVHLARSGETSSRFRSLSSQL